MVHVLPTQHANHRDHLPRFVRRLTCLKLTGQSVGLPEADFAFRPICFPAYGEGDNAVSHIGLGLSGYHLQGDSTNNEGYLVLFEPSSQDTACQRMTVPSC